MKFGKFIKYTVGSILLVGLAVWVFLPETSENEDIIFPVTQGNIQKTVSASGILQAVEQVDIGAQVSGQIKKISVVEGQRVKKGDLLAVIDPQLAETELKLAKAELETAQANLDVKSTTLKQHRTEFLRHRELMKKGATTQQALEEARMRLDVSNAEIKSAQSSLESAAIRVDRAQTQLGYTEVRSPMDGVVISLIAKNGQTLATSQQVPILMKLANIDTMQINAKISEADVIGIQKGAEVSFTLLGDPNQRFFARLDDVKLAPTHIGEQSESNNSANNNAIYYYATFKVPNPEHKLRISMTASVTIFLDKKENVLTIPLSALGKMVGANEYEVTVLNALNEKQKKTIKTGLKDDSKVEVLDGLAADELVVLSAGATSVDNEEIYNIL